MAPLGENVAPRKLPDDKHLAFAVSIVLSKPNDLTIEEYIVLLRQHIAKGRRENALSSVHRHLDRSSYWRSEYERVKDALSSADKECLDLKLEIDRLKAKGASGPSVNPVKKRKKQDDADVVPVPRSPKRPRPATSEKETALSPSTVDADFSFAHLGENGENLMRSFYRVHALLKSRERTDPALLAQHLIQAADAVSEVLQNLAKQRPDNSEEATKALRNVLAAVIRAMQSLLIGYARLTKIAEGAEVQGQIVYRYVHVLEKSMLMLSDFTKGAGAGSVPATRQERPSTSKGKSKQGAMSSVKQGKHISLDTVSSFVARSMDLLDAKVKAHKPLFEGMAYVLIERLGACLYTLSFGRARAATMEHEIAAAAQPDAIEDDDETSPNKLDEEDVKLAKIEAPYLVRLLAHLMRAAPAHFGASTPSKPSKSKAAQKQPMKDNLAITAKERLQRTLVNCMFGTEGVDETDLFMDCLRKPVCDTPLPTLPAVKEADVQEWFKEEVWQLLGWEILAREGGW